MTDIASLFQALGSSAWTLFFFIVALSIIVAVHEYGHYIIGRWGGIHAEVFSIGFGPVLATKVDRFGTRWQFAALPFGGYVRFKGDADATSRPDTGALDTISQSERRSTMQGAPLWARSSTVLAGPVFNFIFSILVFACIFMWNGQSNPSLTIGSITPGPWVNELAVGDKIISINDVPVDQWDELEPFQSDPTRYQVARDGQILRDLAGPVPFAPIIRFVSPQSAAWDAGLEIGEIITAIDGTPMRHFSDVQSAVLESAGRELSLKLWSPTGLRTVTIAAERRDIEAADGFETRWLLGVNGGLVFEPLTEPLGPISAIIAGFWRVLDIIRGTASGIYHMLIGAISTCNLSGPVTIAETSGQVAQMGPLMFFSFVGVISTAIGLMNLLPVPGLDGGHLVFHAYEAITRRPPSERAVQILMSMGIAIVLSMMFFALLNDFLC